MGNYKNPKDLKDLKIGVKMDWLRIFKIKIYTVVFSLSAICYGNDTKVNMNDRLLGSVEMGNFAQFKNLYSEREIADGQKEELLAMANKIIEREKANWPKLTIGSKVNFWGDITKVKEAQFRRKIRMLQGALLLGGIGIVSGLVYFVIRYIEPLNEHIHWLTDELRIIQQGISTTPGVTAATMAQTLTFGRNLYVAEVRPRNIIYCSIVGLFGISFGWTITRLNELSLSYNRFKGATKIKKLIQQSFELVNLAKV